MQRLLYIQMDLIVNRGLLKLISFRVNFKISLRLHSSLTKEQKEKLANGPSFEDFVEERVTTLDADSALKFASSLKSSGGER